MDSPLDMSTEQLLSEIESDTLQEFLASCRQEALPRCPLHMPSLNSYLSDEALSHTSSKYRDHFEILGPSGSGKTHLLYSFLAACILPIEHNFGWGKAAFVIDMDGTFRMSHFHQILVARLEEFLPPLAVSVIVENCLRSVQIFRPGSQCQLDITLNSLARYHIKLFPNLDLGMIAIHSIDTFYWMDRFKAEQLKSPALSTPKLTGHRNTASSLHKLLRTHNATIVTTHWAFSEQINTPDSYVTESVHNIRQPNTTRDDRFGSSGAISRLLDASLVSRYQMLLTPGRPRRMDPVGGSPYQEVQILARAFHRPDRIKFTMRMTSQGVIVESAT